MFDFQQKRRLRSFLGSKLVWLVLILAIGFMIVSTYKRYTIALEMAERRSAAEAELERLRLREDELSQRVDYLSHERGIEAEMRRRYDVALPGEQVVIIVDEEDRSAQNTSTTAPSSTSTTPARPWYRFW